MSFTIEGEGRPTGGEQISPAVAASEETWKPVEIWTGCIGICGGFNRKPLSVSCIEVQQGVETHRFVHLNTRAEWFLKGVGGPKTQKGGLKAVHVVEVIRARIKGIFEEEDDTDVDPMESFNESRLRRTRLLTRRPNKRKKSALQEVEVPRRPDCVGLGEATKITVYLKGCGQRNFSKRPIYLRVDGLDWLLSYAADEHFSQGVKSAAVDEIIVKKANCAAVADLNLEWDWQKRVWQAEFVSGPLKGTTRRFGRSDLTRDRVKKMKVKGICQPSFQGVISEYRRQKKQTKDFIVRWCEAISQGNHTFEVTWDLKETTGQRKRKRARRK